MNVQVYIEGKQIVLDLGIQKQILNLSQSQKLVQEIHAANQVLEKNLAAQEKEVFLLSQKLEHLRNSCALSPETVQKCAACWNQGAIEEGLLVLSSAEGNVFASFFELDEQGWAVLRGGLNLRGCIALCFALSQLGTEHFLHKLWSWGAFDVLLMDAIGQIEPSQIPSSLFTRLFPMLAQECFIPSGHFSMGYDGYACLPCEYPVQEISLSNGFYVGRFPVTQLLYWLITSLEPSGFVGASRPVERVSWYDAVHFCNAYSKAMGLESYYRIDGDAVECIEDSEGYRLLTEAEWECAARAWSPYFFSGADDPHSVAWFSENSDHQTHIVGKRGPNSAHIYDMTGNVWEWVWDWYREDYYSLGVLLDPKGPSNGRYRCCRGGGYTSSGESARISIRGSFSPTTTKNNLGFRIGRTFF